MKVKAISILVLSLFAVIVLRAQEQKEIQVESFNQVKFEGSAQWVLIPSDVEKVVIESSNTDVFNYVEVDHKGDMLIVRTTDKNKNITKLFKSVTINVYFNEIEKIALSGVGSVSCKETSVSSTMEATLRGTGNMYLDVQCTEFIGNMHGTGMLSVKGLTDRATARVEGVGSFEAYELMCTNMNVTVSGVGGAKVYASNTLTATLNGVGSIRYKGDPETKNFNTNGLGNIKRAK